jgi:alanine-alpha-ketoisovalerate/valine-pyruvate aminotransferase
MKNQDNDTATSIETIAKLAVTKLFQAIQAIEGDIANRFDLTKLAGDAIVSTYREGMQHGQAITKWSLAPANCPEPLIVK